MIPIQSNNHSFSKTLIEQQFIEDMEQGFHDMGEEFDEEIEKDFHNMKEQFDEEIEKGFYDIENSFNEGTGFNFLDEAPFIISHVYKNNNDYILPTIASDTSYKKKRKENIPENTLEIKKNLVGPEIKKKHKKDELKKARKLLKDSLGGVGLTPLRHPLLKLDPLSREIQLKIKYETKREEIRARALLNQSLRPDM